MPMYRERAQLGLNPRRQAVVEKAFAKLDVNGNDVISADEMIKAYDATRHPMVAEGTLSPSQALEAFVRQFDEAVASRDGRITRDDFMKYYTKMSIEIDRGREIDKDGFFELVVRRSWRLDEDEMPTLSQTMIIPHTLELPTGMARAKNMDLVWMGADGKTLVGYKAAIKTVFPRRELPDVLKGFFALYGELDRIPVSYLAPKAAVLPSYDFVWPTESGDWVGYKGVVNSNITLQQLPEDLQALIKTNAESEDLKVTFLPTAPTVANPNFTKSSDTYGKGEAAYVECSKMAALRVSTFNGTSAGTKYIGRNGKFTNEMPSPSPSAGLNCGTVKKAWGL
eukprot:GILI01014538.1.p1 GENE.GILI01014538.1~~GILI01014538.1.p1  ORF type:complete len:338 (+),score=88.05 GILI01014538.1:44-1057(+)